MSEARHFGAEQVDTFRRTGYVLVRGLFDAQRMRDLDRWTDEMVAAPEVPGRHMVYYEDSFTEPGSRILSRIENFCAWHAGFDALLRRGEVIERVGALLGEPAVLFKDKINFKLPGASGFKAHQDVQAGWDAYASLHVTMLVSIDPASAENGYLELAPGFHDRGLLGRMWEPLDEDAIPGLRYEPCPTEPGDVVFFDSFIPHRSAENHTDRPRRVLYVTYNRRSEGDHRARYYADKRAGYPPDCEREPGREYVYKV